MKSKGTMYLVWNEYHELVDRMPVAAFNSQQEAKEFILQKYVEECAEDYSEEEIRAGMGAEHRDWYYITQVPVWEIPPTTRW